jgi:adenylyl-sulfate kinase
MMSAEESARIHAGGPQIEGKFWLIANPCCGDEDGMTSATGSNRSMGLVVWLTGLSASGKSTLANALAAVLRAEGQTVVVLDGDLLRAGLCRDLGFSESDRMENVRRAGAVAALLAQSGVICIAALISPFASSRDAVRKQVPAGRFLEVFVDAPLELCEKRDPKGLYARARRGEIPTFTGVSSPYEPPAAAECVVRTGEIPIQEATDLILARIRAKG